MRTTTNSTSMPNLAQREGWTVLDCGTHPDGSPIIQMQKLDFPQPGFASFADDRDAWDYVVARARTGSVPHRAALGQVDPVERTLIEASCGAW